MSRSRSSRAVRRATSNCPWRPRAAVSGHHRGRHRPTVAADLSPDAVAIAVLVKEEHGTLVSVATEVEIVRAGPDIPFSVGYDPDLIDPAIALRRARPAIVDGSGPSGTRLEPAEVIVDGTPIEYVQVEVGRALRGDPGPAHADA